MTSRNGIDGSAGDGSAGDADYGKIGGTYTDFRRPEPRIAQAIEMALGQAKTVTMLALVPDLTNQHLAT